MQQSNTHDSSCRCPDCRARRTSQRTVGGPAVTTATQAYTPPPLTLERGEQEAITSDPLAYVMDQKEQDVSVQVIRNKLILAGVDADDADSLIQETEILYKDDQHERGIRRIKRGVALAVGGLVLTIPLALFGGIFVLGGIILTLAGVFQLGKGIYEVKG